jgi:RES domain-containing protein
MSEEFATAVAEYEQDLGIRPGTLCAYEVDAGHVADLTDADTLNTIGYAATELLNPWKQIALVEKRRPSSWDLAVRLNDQGIVGIRVPSVQAHGANLVLWRWNAGPECRVAAFDPLNDLPRDQSSWRARSD